MTYASMGPWLRSHGRLGAKVMAATEPLASMGPWLRSHGRLADGVGSRPGQTASMGPWLRSHGRENEQAREGDHGGASMGPWLRSHGRTRRDDDENEEDKLQWGRGFAATEGRTIETSRSAEARFNGAVASQPRKATQVSPAATRT